MKKIIVVEDDKMLGRVYVNKLSLNGYRAEQVETQAEAFSKIKAEKPDLVLLDLILPDGDGFEVLEEIRADNEIKDTKVFVLSKISSEIEKSHGKKLNLERYLNKSTVTFDEVIRFIEEVIGK